MQPTEFVKTIYLGDRACKGLLVDGWNERVTLQVDSISRIRSSSGQWDFYTDEDIDDGLIVFTDVKSIKFAPAGPIPNDLINSFEVSLWSDSDVVESGELLYVFRLSVGSIDNQGHTTEVVIDILASGVHLESPINPGVAITE